MTAIVRMVSNAVLGVRMKFRQWLKMVPESFKSLFNTNTMAELAERAVAAYKDF